MGADDTSPAPKPFARYLLSANRRGQGAPRRQGHRELPRGRTASKPPVLAPSTLVRWMFSTAFTRLRKLSEPAGAALIMFWLPPSDTTNDSLASLLIASRLASASARNPATTLRIWPEPPPTRAS